MKQKAQQNKPTFSYARYLESNKEEKAQIKQSQQKSKDLEKLIDDITGRLNAVKQSVRDYTLCSKQSLDTIVLKELSLTSWEPVRQSGQSIFDYASIDNSILKRTTKIIGRLGLAESFHRKDDNEQLIKAINLGIQNLSEFNTALDNFATEASSLTVSDMSLLNSRTAEKLDAVITNIFDTWINNKIYLSDGNKIHLERVREAIKQILSNESMVDNVTNDFEKILKNLKKDFKQTLDRVKKKDIFRDSVDLTKSLQEMNDAVVDQVIKTNQPLEMRLDVDLIAQVTRRHNLNDTQVERLLQLIKRINIEIFIAKVEYALMSKMPSAKLGQKEICKVKIAYMVDSLESTPEKYNKLALGVKLFANNGDFIDKGEHAIELRKAKQAVVDLMSDIAEVSIDIPSENTTNTTPESLNEFPSAKHLAGDEIRILPSKPVGKNIIQFSFILFFLISAPIGVFTNLFFMLNAFDLFITLLGVYGAALLLSIWMGGDSNG